MPKLQDELKPIFSSPESINNDADIAMLNGIVKQFPIVTDTLVLELHDPFVDKKQFTHKEEKEAILNSKSLTYPIKGTLILKDKATGKVLDKLEKYSLGDTYHITNKHTLVSNGNNYSIANLIQLREGVYTLRKANDEVSTMFNTGRGGNFSLGIDAKKAIVSFKKINDKETNKPVAPVLTQVFRIPESEITKYIPKDIWEVNKAAASGAGAASVINYLFENVVDKMVRYGMKNPSMEEKCEAIRKRFEEQTLDNETTQVTLGKGFSANSGEAFLLAVKKIIDVYKGTSPQDNRDSLQFKRVQNLPDYLTRRFKEGKVHDTVRKAVNDIGSKISRADGMEKISLRNILPSKPFSKVYTDFVNTSSLCSTPDETNSLESLENVGKVTVISSTEAGIGDIKGVPKETRNVHPSHLGIIDPSRTPESEMAGLDQRFTITAHRDKEGRMYARAIDAKTKKQVYLSTHELMTKKIGFPGQMDKKDPMVNAQVNGEFKSIPRSEVDYWIPSGTDLYTVTTNMVPFLNSNHPGRLTMAGKALPQALSLVHREVPLVQTLSHTGTPYIEHYGQIISTVAPVDGVITHVGEEEVHIKSDEDGSKQVIGLVRNLPFNRKGFHDDEKVKVNIGDRVSAGQVLADNNYTKDGQLAIGKNLYAAYIPYKGYNHEDGIVISRSAAKDMTSHHAYKYKYEFTKTTKADKKLFIAKFNGVLTNAQLAKLDDKGFVKKGETLHHGDPIYAVLEERPITEVDRVFNRVGKSKLSDNFRFTNRIEYWDHEEPGLVVETASSAVSVNIIIRSEKELSVGDKITGLHGNKGIVSLILEDHEMPHSTTTGKAVDLLLNPASVTSRINLGQVLETAAAKIAAKTGKPYKVLNYENENNLTKLIGELKEHGISDKDTITQLNHDSGKHEVIGDRVLAGPQYFIKLNKTTEEAYSVRGIGKGLSYDVNAQPGKGGDDGSKSIGYMEFLGLLGSNARANLKEIGTVKSEGGANASTSKYWTDFMDGEYSLPAMKTTFATKKFMSYLKGCGINVRKVKQSDGTFNLKAAPMTDADVLKLSEGRELKEYDIMKATRASKEEREKGFAANDIQPIEGGMFDYNLTGGPEGNLWSHYKLAEPLLNPVLENPVREILGLKKDELTHMISGKYGVKSVGNGTFHLVDSANESLIRPLNIASNLSQPMVKKADEGKMIVGGDALKAMLGSINIKDEIAHLAEQIKAPKCKDRDKLIKRMKFLAGFANNGHETPATGAIMNYMPVIPPTMRPFVKTDKKIDWADVNKLYKANMRVHKDAQDMYDIFGGKDQVHASITAMQDVRKEMYESAKAIMANGKPTTPNDNIQKIKGLMRQITGVSSPKEGFVHERLLKRRQDFSGRGTIFAAPDIGFDEAKFPKDMLWTLYKAHIMRDLVARKGHNPAEARQAYEDRNLIATQSFGDIIQKVPVLLNRNPTLMRTNIMALKPIPIDGKTIGLNPLHLPAYAADYDGDALSAFVPMTDAAIKEANEKLLPSKFMNDARIGFGSPMFAPGHEAILGSVHLTSVDKTKDVVEFTSKEAALQALKEGKITDDTPVRIVEGNGG